MAYGVTPEGFFRPRLPEIRQEIIAALRARLREAGLPDDIETRPDSVLGLLIDTFAERETALWEMGEGVYYGMYPGSAVGAALDRAVSFTGVTRRVAERSAARVILYGVQGTSVPAGAQIRHRTSQVLWATDLATTISSSNAADVSIIPTLVPSATYTVTIDGVGYSYVAGLTPTVGDVLTGLVGQISGAPGVVASSNGAALRIVVVGATGMPIALSSNLTFTQLGSSVIARTIEAIPDAAEIGDLNSIVTLTPGWESVTNLTAGSVGRLQETDAELRVRYETGLFRLGAATLPSIAPNVRDRVTGVSEIKVVENATDETDADGRLPHSIHVVVEGGVDTEIAEAIYRVKGAGIDTNGDIVTVLQTTEGLQTIRFDRPDYIYIWAKASLTLLPPSEQPFPSNGFELIRAAINDVGQQLTIGQDVILQRFFCAIYATPGLAAVDLKFASSTNPAFVPTSGDYTAANVPIEDWELARFDISRIEVT